MLNLTDVQGAANGTWGINSNKKNKMFKRKKGSKYHNEKVVWNGIRFDSTKEKDRMIFLSEAQERGEITNLERQVKYVLIPAIKERYIKHYKTKDKVLERTIQLATTYAADFRYIRTSDGKEIVEDVKSTPYLVKQMTDYQLKKKMLRYVYGVAIREVYKPNEAI